MIVTGKKNQTKTKWHLNSSKGRQNALKVEFLVFVPTRLSLTPLSFTVTACRGNWSPSRKLGNHSGPNVSTEPRRRRHRSALLNKTVSHHVKCYPTAQLHRRLAVQPSRREETERDSVSRRSVGGGGRAIDHKVTL